jgi:hypothetical protein
MAKALLGQYVRHDDRLVWEAARLRERVQDLLGLVDSLQEENDTLRAELEARRFADEMAISLNDAALKTSLDEVELDHASLTPTS